MKYGLAAVLLGLFVSSCSTHPSGANLSPDQQGLLVKCPPVPAQLSDGTGRDAALVIKEVAAIYHDCKIRHNGLVDAVNRMGPSGEQPN